LPVSASPPAAAPHQDRGTPWWRRTWWRTIDRASGHADDLLFLAAALLMVMKPTWAWWTLVAAAALKMTGDWLLAHLGTPITLRWIWLVPPLLAGLLADWSAVEPFLELRDRHLGGSSVPYAVVLALLLAAAALVVGATLRFRHKTILAGALHARWPEPWRVKDDGAYFIPPLQSFVWSWTASAAEYPGHARILLRDAELRSVYLRKKVRLIEHEPEEGSAA
jgi:hypothetical protein